ncbi:MAG: FAD-dependent oxidoreductase [Synergistaceae bacterium]|nr:FAD-dependent oxidoreductase [Synergistaceae bacterium]
MEKFDAIVIGFGKGGKTLAAALAAQGSKVALVEKSDKMYGGSCPNVGCVPTKFLVNRAELSRIKELPDFERKAAFYAGAVRDKKRLREKILDKMFNIFDSDPQITLYTGTAKFTSPSEIEVTGRDYSASLTAEKIVIDTGALPFIPPIEGLAECPVAYSSEGMLELEKLPRRLVVIGGGNIGLEFASIYRRFGSEVTVLQDLPGLFPNEDEDVAAAVTKTLEEQGINFVFGVKILSVENESGGAVVKYAAGGKEASVKCDALLVSTGRVPNTGELNLQAAGVETTPRGAIVVDERMRTTAPGIWAIGDAAGSPQFTYISQDDARIVLDDFNGGDRKSTGRNIPYSVFLFPPLSRVGLTEKEALAKGYEIKSAVMPVTGLPRSHVLGSYTGMLKAVVDAKTGLILGAALYCEESHEMINIVTLAMNAKLPYSALRDMIFTHPVMSEALNDLFSAVK